MARLQIGEQAWEIARFRLRELRAAAPFIDRIAARARDGRLDTVSAVAESAADMLGVLAAGIEGGDAAAMEAVLTLPDLDGLRASFEQVLQEAGLTRAGEAQGLASPVPSPPS